MTLDRAASIDDLRHLAQRRVPRFAFDFLDGGAESERNLRGNCAAFEAVTLQPRALIDVSEISTGTRLFGQDYGVPFGMAPVGFLNAVWPGSDLAIARLAAEKRMPHAISTASSTKLETLAEAAEGHAWFQIYVSRDQPFVDALLDRAWAAGCRVLLVTVDTAHPGKRDRDIRNGLQMPFRLTPRLAWDLARHPRWSLATMKAGPPVFANAESGYNPGSGSGSGKDSLVELQRRMISSSFTWEDLARIRDRWKGTLVLKGVLHSGDARQAVAMGADGILVSNHGGRQIDYGPTSLEVLPGIVKAVAGRAEVMLDSGVRRGADVLRAKALGACFVLAGRAFGYGAGAGGAAGCRHAFDILETELTRAMGQLGCPSFQQIGPGILAS